MNLKIALCDDSEADRTFTRSLVRRWADSRSHNAAIFDFPSAESFLFAYEEERDFDLLLLDIEMGGMDGVTMAKRLRQDDGSMQIVFITGYSDYISEGYEVSALHYLVKPVGEEKLFSVLDRAAARIEKDEKALSLDLGYETLRLPIRDITYADVQGNYVTIHGKSTVTVRMTLRDLESRLDDRFYRVGRSGIVNLNCISRVTRTDVYLSDGSVVPLPRGAYEGVNRAIIRMG